MCAKHGVALCRGKTPEASNPYRKAPGRWGDTIPGFCLGGDGLTPLHPSPTSEGTLFHPQKLTEDHSSCSQVVRFLGSEIFTQLFLKGIEVQSAPAFTAAGPADLLAEPMGRPAPCPGQGGPS